MNLCPLFLALLVSAEPDLLGPGDHTRSIKLGEQTRSYLVHIPKGYDPKKPTPVVLALHGAAMNGPMMAPFCGLSAKADEGGFIVVYPSGTGAGIFLTWNAGGIRNGMGSKADDVAFIGKLLDDLGTVATVDPKRVYACGMSNGAMMCYKLAAELSDRIAAIAPVAGTIAIEESKPKRPVPVLHFHGTKDTFVPFGNPAGKTPGFMRLKSVEDSVQTWVKLNGCEEKPRATDELSKAGDELKVTRKSFGPGKDGAEVVLITIDGGGHTWPGQKPPVGFMGKSAMNISANDLIWEFFQKHSLK
ncbi:MAG: dienelactone hydrolase family protein [Planctomycetia bacterium]|nr:dienelactone hydrolase family protein [Planctomycetia bacterium]